MKFAITMFFAFVTGLLLLSLSACQSVNLSPKDAASALITIEQSEVAESMVLDYLKEDPQLYAEALFQLGIMSGLKDELKQVDSATTLIEYVGTNIGHMTRFEDSWTELVNIVGMHRVNTGKIVPRALLRYRVQAELDYSNIRTALNDSLLGIGNSPLVGDYAILIARIIAAKYGVLI